MRLSKPKLGQVVFFCFIFSLNLLLPSVLWAEPQFVNNAFQIKWQRADKAVADSLANPARSWVWGPEPFIPADSSSESYAESPGQLRQVQYFDKARMEINDPATGAVTNGLLVRELISGRLATGDKAFIQRKAADDIPIAGDPANNMGPTYASFVKVASLNNDNQAQPRTGAVVQDSVDQVGNVGTAASDLSNLAHYTYFDANLKHNIPDVFWSFLNQKGNVYQNGQYKSDQSVLGENPLAPWVDTTGLPVTEAYWARATVAGQPKDVLIQAFERRVLTYTPSNSSAYQVEMGNVGRHYFNWRYNTRYNLVRPAASVFLTGVNLAGAEFSPDKLPGSNGTDYAYPTHAEVDYFWAKGMNIFRLPIAWERLQPERNGDFSAEQLNLIDDFINYATAKGAQVILDPHNYARYYGKTIGQNGLALSDFAGLWGKLGAHYKNNNRVIFGLMNEPLNMPTQTWVAAANAAIQAIRTSGSNNLILVAGSSPTGSYNWNQIWSGTAYGQTMLTISDPANNYAYELHEYLDADISGTSDRCVSPNIGVERLRDFTLWLRQNNQRGFLGEFGGGRNDTCYVALDNMLTYIDSNLDVWMGWTYWAAGPLWGDYILSIEPVNGNDRPQMAPLSKHFYGVNRPINTKNFKYNQPTVFTVNGVAVTSGFNPHYQQLRQI